jgi:hypothetical protein
VIGGLLINGERYPVDGVNVVSPNDTPWSHLSPGDGKPRTRWPTQVILHKTKADDPEHVVPGAGPYGRAERVAKFWQDDPAHSGAHLVVGGDYTACLADLVRFEAWHANQANERSIGIEHCEEAGGIVHELVLAAGMRVCLKIAEVCGIQLQVPRGYSGKPLRRFADGGSTLVGFFGHRDVSDRRGRWDPGERIFGMLINAGAETFDFDAGEDLVVWKARQVELNRRGHNLVVDGVPGPATTAALRAEGYRGGVFRLGR